MTHEAYFIFAVACFLAVFMTLFGIYCFRQWGECFQAKNKMFEKWKEAEQREQMAKSTADGLAKVNVKLNEEWRKASERGDLFSKWLDALSQNEWSIKQGWPNQHGFVVMTSDGQIVGSGSGMGDAMLDALKSPLETFSR
jgi:hypothetical protein